MGRAVAVDYRPSRAGRRTGGVGPDAVWVVDAYEDALRARGLAEKTRSVYVQTVRRHLEAVDPMTCQVGDLERWLASLDVGANTVGQTIVRLRQFYRWAQRAELRADNPTDLLDSPRIPRARPRPIPDCYLEAIWERAEPVERAWIVLGLYCGLRAGEVVRLRVEDFEGDELVVVGKGQRVRRVPVRAEVFAALDAVGWPKRGRFFPGVGEKAASIAIGRLLREVGAPPRITMHSLRHRAASEWYRASRDVKVVSELLGHASIETTMIYAEADLDHAKAVVGRVPAMLPASA
jgi:integrase